VSPRVLPIHRSRFRPGRRSSYLITALAGAVLAPAAVRAQEAPSPQDVTASPQDSTPAEAPAAALPPAPPPPPPPVIVAPAAAAPPAPGGGLLFHALLAAGESNYEDRASGDIHMFGEGLAAVSAGHAAVRKPAGTLDVSGELLLSRSFQGSPGAHAAGNLTAFGLVLSTFLETARAEIALGGYLVRRDGEARTLALASGNWSAGIGATLARYWPVTQGWSWGLAVKVLALPTSTTTDADGEKHTHFSDGLGVIGLSAAWR